MKKTPRLLQIMFGPRILDTSGETGGRLRAGLEAADFLGPLYNWLVLGVDFDSAMFSSLLTIGDRVNVLEVADDTALEFVSQAPLEVRKCNLQHSWLDTLKKQTK